MFPQYKGNNMSQYQSPTNERPKFAGGELSQMSLKSNGESRPPIDATTSPLTSPETSPQRFEEHEYHDHAHETRPPTSQHDRMIESGSCFAVGTNGLGGAGLSFPLKLHAMLSCMEAEGLSEVVAWQPHGRCFIIHQMDRFEALLPRFFGLDKKASWQRQLNMYGFKRITAGRDKGGYYHELFLRGMGFLASRLKRIRIKGKGARAKANPKQEPNFWKMEWLPSRSLPPRESASEGNHRRNEVGTRKTEDSSRDSQPPHSPRQESEPNSSLPDRRPSYEYDYRGLQQGYLDWDSKPRSSFPTRRHDFPEHPLQGQPPFEAIGSSDDDVEILESQPHTDCWGRSFFPIGSQSGPLDDSRSVTSDPTHSAAPRQRRGIFGRMQYPTGPAYSRSSVTSTTQLRRETSVPMGHSATWQDPRSSSFSQGFSQEELHTDDYEARMSHHHRRHNF